MYPIFPVYSIMETNSLQRTLQALRVSFSSSSNSKVHQATCTLSDLSKQPGYLPNLVEIVNEQTDQPLIYAALAQLKNQLKDRWRAISSKDAIPSADKVYFLERLVQMNVRMMGNYGYFKLLKDLVVIVAENAICLLPQVLQMLENGHHLKPCLNVLLGISEFYRFQSALQEKNTFLKSLEKILPIVLGLVHKGEHHLLQLYQQIQQSPSQQLVDIYNQQKELFEEILYLSIKLVYKCISSDLPINLLPFLIQWAAIAIGRLAEENEDHDKKASSNPFNCGDRGTDMFNYFHGKKWSAKFMVKFIEKVLISKKSSPEISSISEEFYHSRGREVEFTVVELLKRPKPNSVRFYEIYLIDMIFQKRPQLLENYSRLFLFDILPPLFLPSEGDIQEVQNNPADFFFSETYQGHQTKNVKLVATALWIQLAFRDSSDKIEGTLLQDSLRRISDWLYECLQAKQIAVYLLAHMSFKMSGIQKAKEKVSKLLEICIPAIFEQPNLLLQVRGFELIKAYPLLLQNSILDPLIKMVLNIFRESLSGQKNITLAIYGGIALEKLIFYGGRIGLRLCNSDVRIVLNVLLQLIKSEKLDQLSQTLLTIAQAYPEEISIHSVDLANHLFSTFHEAIDRAQIGEGHSHYHHIQSILNILHELVKIANSSNHQEILLLQALEEGVASSIQSLLLRSSTKIINQYIEGLLKLLSSLINAQTNKRNELPSRLSFPFILLIANLSPLQPAALQALTTSPLTRAQKHIMTKQDLNLGLETQISFQLLRNYLKFLGDNPFSIKIMKQDELSRQFFSANFLNQFMNIVYFYFRIPHGGISPEQLSEICRGRYLCTHVLTSLLENHQQLPPTLLKKIMQIMIINLKSEKLGGQLVKCNFMLFCAWLAKVPNPLEPLEESLNTPPNKIALRFIMPTGKNMLYELRTPLERRRVTLAFARIIELAISSISLRTLLHFAFTWVMYLLDLNFARSSQDQDLGITEQPQPPSYELEYEIEEQQCGDYTAVEEANEFLVAMRSFKKMKDHDPQLFREHALNANYYSFLKLYELARLSQDPEFRELLDEQ